MSITIARSTRARLLVSACFLAVPGVAGAQTVVSTPVTTNQNISGNGTLTVTPTGSVVVSGNQAVNINGTSLGTGVVITVQKDATNTGRIEGVASTNANGRGISSSGDFADRTTTINNAGAILGSNDAIRFASTTATFVSTGTITINNTGAITGVSGNGTAQASGAQGIENIVLGTDFIVNNSAGATISGSQGILSAAATTTINNSGTITGTGAISTQGEAIRTNLVSTTGSTLVLNNAATGNITGVFGLIATGASNTIDNYGTISGSANSATSLTREGIRFNAGLSANQVNTVTLRAGSTTTAGTGTGASGNAVVFGGTPVAGFTVTNTLNVEAGAIVNGGLNGSGNAAATDTLNLQISTAAGAPTSAVLGTASNFDVLNVQGGTWGITSAFNLSGGATIAAGATLRYDDAGATGGSIAGGIVNNGTLIDNRTATVTNTGAITGTGALQVVNTGTLVLTGGNSYSGATTISNGRLRTGQFANSFSANSAVTVTGAGILDLNDTTVDINAVATPIARDNIVASIAGDGTVRLGQLNAATLTAGGNNATTTFSGTFTQLGNLTKVGTGTLTLSGANTATGLLSVNGGGVALSGSWAGATTLADNTALGGAGTIGGVLTVGAASVSPGNNGIGTLTTGGLTLSGGSQLNYQLGAPGTAGDLIQVNGNLTLDGTLNVADVGGFGVGVYRLMNYTGLLTDNGLVIGSIPAGTNSALFSVQTSVATQINLIYGAPAPTTLQFWDGADLVGNGVVDGGTGSWTNNLPNWTNANGTNNTAWTGNFAVFQGAAGVVAVNDAIAFTGAQFLTDGYQIVGGTGTLSAAATLTTLRVDPGVTATITANIGGTGGLLKNDAGTIVLGGTNSYAGATTILGGTLRATGGNAVTDGSAVSVAAGATLDVAASETIGDLTGAGAVTLSGGTLTTGNSGASTAFDGTISGGGGLTKAGAGTFTLNGANTYTGATTVNAGTLALGGAGSIGGGNLAVATGATLALNGRATGVGALSGGGTVQFGANGALTTTSATNSSFTGTLAGAGGTFTKAGAGTLTLGGTGDLGTIAITGGRLVAANSGAIGTAAAVTVGGGTLELTANQSIASLAGTGPVVLTGATLTVNGAASTTYAGTASGSGGLAKTGTGTLTLTGASGYTGGTAVSGGTLQLNGSVAGAATVSGGATLAGSGVVGGVVTVADGRLSPGAAGAVGTLTTGGLVLGAASNLDYQLGAPGSTGDRIQVNGNLTLDGTLNVTDIGGFGAGVYRLIDYTGALTDNGLLLGAIPNTVTRSRVTVQTAVATQINLVVGGALPAIQFWDGPNTVSNGVIDGGSGSWNNTRTSWTDANGQNNDQWGGQFAVFQGAAGTVTVDDAIQFSGMQFVTNGYTIAAGTGALEATQALTNIRVDPGVTATIGASIAGAGGLNKLDTGTLILSGANSYAGVTTVAGGTLRASGAGSLPTGTAVSVALGATLDVAAAQTIGSLAGAGAVTLGAGLTTGGSNADTSFTGVISGAGSLTKAGTGTMTLGGANSYAGGTNVNAGTLRLAAGGSFGTGALAVAAGATADLAGNAASVGGLNGAGSVTLGAATLTVNGAGGFAGVVSGSGGLTKAGTGTLTLSGVNTYTGATTVNGGTLAIGTGTIPVASAVTIGAAGTLALNGSVQVASLNGAGAVALGANTLTLGSGTYAGVIGGTGGLTKTGAGTLTLSGTSSYTGATAVTGGVLALAGTNAIATSSAVALTGGAQLNIAGGSAQTVQNLTGVAGTAIVLGANQLTINNAATSSLASTISGTGGIVKTGAGNLTLAVANTHSGGTTVNAGTLTAGAANAFGTGVLTVTAPGSANLVTFAQTVSGLAGDGAVALGTATLTLTGAGTTSYAGVLSGTGGLTKTGTGTQTLGGASTYTGATSVTGGTLLVNGSTTSAVTVGNAGRLGGTGTVASFTSSGTISPGTTTTTGTLRVAGTASFGATSILEVNVTPAGASDLLAATGTVTISGGGVQVLTGGATAFTPLTTYTILTGSSVTGTFGSVTSDLAFLTPSLVYNPASVQLRLVRNDISFAAIGQTPNQRAVGTALQPQLSGALFDAVIVLSAADARAAFDQVSGELHAATAMIARREGHAAGRAVLDRLETASGKGVQLWIEGSAGSTTVNARTGYADVDASRYGIAGGAEIAGEHTRGGIGFRHAVANTDLDARNSTGDITLDSAFVYFGHDFGALRFGVTGSIGFLGVDTDRRVAFTGFTDRLTGHEKGQSFTAAGELAFLPEFGGMRVGPYAGISYVDTVLDGTTEAGGTAALALEKVEDSTGSASYGIRGVGKTGNVTLLADIGGRSYLDSLSGPRTLRFRGYDTMFAVSPAAYARTTVNGRLEAAFDAGPVRLTVGGRAEVGRDTSSYSGRIAAGIKF